MTTSILNTIKALLGLASDDTSFDTDVIIHINSVFMILMQNGVGPSSGFSITGATETWSNFLASAANLEGVKTYIYLKVRLLFDPPTSSTVLEAHNRYADEFLSRLNIECDPPYIPPVEDEDV